MITDKQFEDAFTAAGGWFLLISFERIYNWKRSKESLIEELYSEGFDNKISGTKTRVNCVIRIIENNRGKEALLRVRDSARINQIHPEARKYAEGLIRKYY